MSSSQTVLLLDDDKDLRALLCASLAVEGFRVLEATKGREAEGILASHAVDAIIVDGLLPDGSGVDFIARLRAKDAATPVVFMSAFFRDAKTFRRLTTELGVELVIYKPLDPAELAKRTRQLLGRRSTTESKVATIATPGSAAPTTPAPIADSTIAEAMAALRKEFAAKVPARVAELSDAVKAAERDPSLADAARGLAHRLRGTAGSYGFAALGEAAGRIEDLFERSKGTTSDVPAYFWEEVKGALHDALLSSATPDPVAMIERARVAPGRALLVVDDDADFLSIVREVGRRVAVTVVTAQSASEAMQHARKQPLLGVLLDVHLEGERDSFALATQIRALPEQANVPIAFASVDRRLDTRVGAIEAGGTRFFEKPISAEVFAGLLQQFETLNATQSGHVLVVDDDPDVVREYSLHLRGAGIRVEAALSADAVFERLETTSPDLLILDVNIPHVSGLDVCRAVRISQRWELLPILIATGRGDVETRVKAFRAGASDVLVKPILPDELLARVSVQLDRVRLVRERSEKDSLSGLLLRRPFLEAVQRGLALSAREHKPLSIALLDLDHFKRVNDEHGHAAGDAVIAGLGGLLRRKFRLEDLRGRWGGEEFVIAFPGQTAATTGVLVTRLLEDFSRMSFSTEKGADLRATFSAGVAEFAVDGSSVAALIRTADDRLYAAKLQGRNRVVTQTTPHAAEGKKG